MSSGLSSHLRILISSAKKTLSQNLAGVLTVANLMASRLARRRKPLHRSFVNLKRGDPKSHTNCEIGCFLGSDTGVNPSPSTSQSAFQRVSTQNHRTLEVMFANTPLNSVSLFPSQTKTCL